MNLDLDLSVTNKSQIGHQILTYLVEHPEAQDTLEGIAEWWLLERAIKFQEAQVKKSLAELVANGLVIRVQGMDSIAHYRINHNKYKEIKKLIKKVR